mgnify:CR=1 FL=1
MSLLQKIPSAKLMLAAVFTFASFPLATLAARIELLHFRFSFLILIFAALVSFILLVISVLKLSRAQQGEGKPLIIAIALTLIPLAVMGSNVIKVKQHPFIHDITTDFNNVPEFIAAKKDRKPEDHATEYEGEAISTLQQQGYPDLKPLMLDLPTSDALAKAESLVKERGWDILATQSENLPFTIEAVVTSALFGFKDDVIVRIREENGQTRLDMRSMSRQG